MAKKDLMTLEVKMTFIEDVLGMSPSDKDIYKSYIASRSPDVANTSEEEVEAVDENELFAKGTTVFPRNKKGQPIFWDYQVMGFFKEACGLIQKLKNTETHPYSNKIKAYKKNIYAGIFIEGPTEEGDPENEKRKIPIILPEGEQIGNLQRPLRASTAQGDRIALASSEVVPAGSTMSFFIKADPTMVGALYEWLQFGYHHGTGQWRNAGYGKFTTQVWDYNTDELLFSTAVEKAKQPRH